METHRCYQAETHVDEDLWGITLKRVAVLTGIIP